ncbi:MAG: PQQ-binding-like beta-propeller repeat protein [Planctomycetota bacterium]
MARDPKLLYIGTNRHVAALDPRTGEELWRTRLPRGSGHPVTMIMKGPYIYAGCYGHVYCLDKRTGEILWENGLPKMGFYTVLLALEGASACTSGDAACADADMRRRQQAAAASSGGATT